MKKRKVIVPLISLAFFLLIGLKVRNTNEGILFDKLILDIIHRNPNNGLIIIMKGISFIGSAYFLIPAIVGALNYTIIKKDYYISKLLIVSTLGSYLANFLLKLLFQRVRPLEYFLVDQGGLSYPSGHSMVAMTLYMTLAYIVNLRLGEEKKKKIIQFFLYAMIILMGISRLYLGVHWPTDILGGYLAGYIFFRIQIYLSTLTI